MNKKYLVVRLILAIIIAYGVYNAFFSSVNCTHVYEGIVSIPVENIKTFERYTKKGSVIFTKSEQWERFKNEYFSGNQVQDFDNKDGEQILLITTNVSKETGGIIYDMFSMKKQFLSIKVTLVQKGEVSKLRGFHDTDIVNYIMIYKIKAGFLAPIYSSYVEFYK